MATLPGTGPISLLDINTMWGQPNGTPLSYYRGRAYYLEPAGGGALPAGQITLADFYGKRATNPVTPGSTYYNSPGTFGFTVPAFNTLVVDVYGGGGSGAAGGFFSQGIGGAGGNSAFNGTVIAYGGAGAANYNTPGAGGGIAGADTGDNGAAGGPYGAGVSTALGYGGRAGAGPSGGGFAYNTGGNTNGTSGLWYGGGGAGMPPFYITFSGGYSSSPNSWAGGGGGGWARRTYRIGDLPIGSVAQVIVGAGAPAVTGSFASGAGAPGAVFISWA